MLLILALLVLLGGPQDFNPGNDPDRTIGDSQLTKASRWNPDPQPSLAMIGDDAIRFSVVPALRGGAGNIITVTPDARGNAVASVETKRLECTDSNSKCRLVSRQGAGFAFCMTADCSYRGFAGQVHALLFDPARMPHRNSDEFVICTDGPGFFTELRERGRTYNLSGFCSENHPNNRVYRLVREGSGANWPAGLGD